MVNIEDMTIKEIRKEIARLEGNSRELREIKATLVVNCRSGRALSKLGIIYDNQRSTLHNVVRILHELVRKIDAKGS